MWSKNVGIYLLIFSLLSSFLVRFKIFWIQKIKAVFLCLLFFSIGMFLHRFHSEKPELPYFKNKETLVFQIDKKLNSNEKNRRYEIKILNEQNQTVSAVLSVPKSIKELDFKHFYRAELIVNQPFEPKNDFQFNYAKYLARKNIYFQTYLPKNIEFAENKQLSFSENIKQKRLEILQKIDDSKLSFDSKNFLKGIILADRTEMSNESVRDFNRSGLMHFLAISGTHIVIIFWLIMFLFNKIFTLKLRKFGIIFSLILIWSFAVFIGFGNSVVRSCIMISVYYASVLLQRKPDLLHSLSLAALMILAVDTQQFFDVGFQLSFLAVLGIFWFNRPILKYFPFPKNLVQKIIFNTISISISAQFATIPLVLFYFHQFSWMSVPANLFIIPFSEIIIISSLVMTIFFMSNGVFGILVLIYDWTIWLLLKIIHWFADWDFAFFNKIPMSVSEMFFCFVILYFLRFPILKFGLKNSMNVVFLLIVFVLYRSVLTIVENKKSETVLIKHFKTPVILDKNQDKITCYIPENADSVKIKQYVLEPFLTKRRTKNFEIKTYSGNHIKINKKSQFE